MTDVVPERPLAELHGKQGYTLMLVSAGVRLGGPKGFGSVPIEEVASCHYEDRGMNTVARNIGIAAAAVAAFAFLLIFLTFDDDWFALVFPAAIVAIVAFSFSFVTGGRMFVVRSRGGGTLALRIGPAHRDAMQGFIEAIERAKAEARGSPAPSGASPTFESYARRR